MQEILLKIENTVLPVIEESNYELVDIEFQKEHIGRVLRIYIDKPGGITLRDCEFIAGKAGALLDALDLIKEPYNLEISSPGINRPVKKEKDFIRFINSRIKLKLFEPFTTKNSLKNNIPQKNFTGYIAGFNNKILTLKIDNNELLEIPVSKIAKAQLEPDIEI